MSSDFCLLYKNIKTVGGLEWEDVKPRVVTMGKDPLRVT